ncbi:MAG TPA: hypothetical protein VE007_00440 [Thermoanaerobaculia bacterium]|nr:hypothetical protein [Thermoanaerobaculia bacterium]
MPERFSRRASKAFSPAGRIRSSSMRACARRMLMLLQTLVGFLGVKRIR